MTASLNWQVKVHDVSGFRTTQNLDATGVKPQYEAEVEYHGKTYMLFGVLYRNRYEFDLYEMVRNLAPSRPNDFRRIQEVVRPVEPGQTLHDLLPSMLTVAEDLIVSPMVHLVAGL